MAKIRLNFLDITPREFSFKVYRKLYNEDEIPLGTTKYKLPLNSGDKDNYKEYSVSFNEIEGFEEFDCNSHTTNNALSVKYIFSNLIRLLESLKIDLKYTFEDRGFEKSIQFEIEKNQFGKKIVFLIPYYLKAEQKFGFLINFRFEKDENVPFNRFVQRCSLSLDENFKSNKNYYSEKFHVLNNFIKEILPYFDYNQLGFSINSNLAELEEKNLNKKEYIFKNSQPAYSQFHGVRSYGVYKTIEEEVLYAFIFENKLKTFANDLFLGLLGKTYPGTFPGMMQMFNLPFNKQNVRKIELINYEKENLTTAVNELKNIVDTNPAKKVIGIFIQDFKDEDLAPTEAPYYILKYHATLSGIPLQVINFEKMSGYNTLKWSIANIALGIFAKLGGVPWKLKPNNDNCLILGIGSSHKKNAEGKIVKYFAYTVCLDSSGIYKKLEVLAEDQNLQNYLKKLENSLIHIIQDNEYSQYTKCALHLPFKIKEDEIQSIQNALTKIRNIEFKVIKINHKNKFFGFSYHNTFVPYESSFIKLSRNEYLVWFDGLNYGKENVYQKVGNPVHIQFLKLNENDPEDNNLSYLQDVINLSGANWRGFNAKQVPISIYYAHLLSKYTKAFKTFPGFNENMFKNTLPWFL